MVGWSQWPLRGGGTQGMATLEETVTAASVIGVDAKGPVEIASVT
jgi:hypothetical protein